MDIEKIKQDLGHTDIPWNMNHYFMQVVEKHPDRLAMRWPKIICNEIQYEDISFKQFLEESLHFTQGLVEQGVVPGDRVVLFFPICLDLYYLICGCFHLGAIPVFVDSAMDNKKILMALKDANAKVIISSQKLLKYRWMFPFMWSVQCYAYEGKGFLYKDYKKLRSVKVYEKERTKRKLKDHTLITFTTGSGGRPKGVDRTLEILCNQKLVGEYYWPHDEKTLDMPFFPMIVLQNLGCGITSIIPKIDLTKIENTDFDLIARQIKEAGVTRFSGPPRIFEELCDRIEKKGLKFEKLTSTIVGGAPVSKSLAKRIVECFPGVENNIVYGSSEAEPISHTRMEDFISSTSKGHLVGNPISCLNVRIARDGELDEISQGVVGEVIMAGPHVVQKYIDNHPANLTNKMTDDQGRVWHRSGDLGYRDEKGWIWLVGRVSDQVLCQNGKIPSYSIEEDLNQLNIKGAIIYKGGKNYLFIEGEFQQDQVDSIITKYKLTDTSIRKIHRLPRDKRHHSKIDRLKLSDIA